MSPTMKVPDKSLAALFSTNETTKSVLACSSFLIPSNGISRFPVLGVASLAVEIGNEALYAKTEEMNPSIRTTRSSALILLCVFVVS